MSHDEEELWLRRGLKRKTSWLYTRLMMASAETNWMIVYICAGGEQRANKRDAALNEG